MDRLKALEVFTRAVQLGGFAAAARDLNLSPAMVGNHVRALESWLGVPLLLRTTRQQTLTEEGRMVLARAESIMRDLVVLEDAANRDSEPSGPLNIAAPIGLGRHLVAPLLRQLSLRFPKLRLDLRLSDRSEDFIKARLDLAVRNGPFDTGEASLVARNLGRQHLVLAASPDYAESVGLPETLEDLSRHGCVRYSRDGRARAWLFPTRDGILKADPPTNFMADDIETLRDAAIDGLGITWLPSWLLQPHFEDGSLIPVLSDVPPYGIDTYLVRPNTLVSPRVQTTIEFLADGLRSRLRT